MNTASPSPKPAWPWIAAILLAAVVVRALHLVYLNLDSDHAVVGLMGMHFLHGEFASMYWSSDYGGTQESWLAALIFALVGPSRPALGAVVVIFGLGFLVAVYLAGKELWGQRAGLAAMFIAALGPYYLVWHQSIPRAIYCFSLFMAALLIWVAARMLNRRPGSRGYLWHAGLFGLLAGQAAWNHPLTAGVILPLALVLWRADPPLVIRPRMAMMLGGFLTGCLPWLYYNLTHNWQTLHFFLAPKRRLGLWADIKAVATEGIPVLLGLTSYKGQGWAVPGLRYLVALLWAAIFLWALWIWGGRLARRLARGRAGDGSELLPAVLAGVLGMFLLVGGSGTTSFRYLIWLYAVIPLAAGWAFARLAESGGLRRRVAWAALLLLAGFNLAGSIAATPLMDPAWRAGYQARRQADQQMINYLAQRHIKYALTPDYWLAKLLTFDAAEKVIVARSIRDRYPPYFYAALRTASPPILATRPDDVAATIATLKAMGARYQLTTVAGRFKVFHPVRPPAIAPVLVEAVGFSARAGVNPGLAARAWDLAAATRWQSPGPQAEGQTYVLDLGRVVPGVCQVLLLPGRAGEQPAGLELAGSADGRRWQTLAGWDHPVWPGFWSGGKMVILPEAPWQELRFAPADLRFLRLRLTRANRRRAWGLVEILVGRRPDRPAPVADVKAAAAWINRRVGKGPVWCEPILQAWLAPRLRVRPLMAFRPDWLPAHLLPRMLMPLDRPVVMALRQEMTPAALRVLHAGGWRVRRETRHGYSLVTALPPTAPAAAALPVRSSSLVDGWWVIDLGRVRQVGGLKLAGAAACAGTGLGLQASRDGLHWRPVPTTRLRPPRLYWAGLLPLAARPGVAGLAFAPLHTRWLRLTLPAGCALPAGFQATPLSPPGRAE